MVGLDYILRWWGSPDSEELAGELDVMWKIMTASGIACYKTWIKLADRDFILGLYRDEDAKRTVIRKEFHQAFAQWRDLFAQLDA